MNDNQTHVVGEAPPLANGSDVLDRLMHLWAVKKPYGGIGGQQCGLEQYIIKADGRMLEAIPDAGDRIIELEKQLAGLRSELIRATNFQLDATRLVRHEEMLNGFEDLWNLEEERASLEQRCAIAQHAADCLEAKCSALNDAASNALALLKKGVPGWGVAKDILALAIHAARLTPTP